MILHSDCSKNTEIRAKTSEYLPLFSTKSRFHHEPNEHEPSCSIFYSSELEKFGKISNQNKFPFCYGTQETDQQHFSSQQPSFFESSSIRRASLLSESSVLSSDVSIGTTNSPPFPFTSATEVNTALAGSRLARDQQEQFASHPEILVSFPPKLISYSLACA